MNDKVHISKTDLYAFKNNSMDPEELMSFLEHISECTYCSDQFAVFMSDDLVSAPVDMKSNILKAVRREQLIKGKVKDVSKRMQLFIYSLKVGAATSLALLMLILMTLSNTGMTDDNFYEVAKNDPVQNVPITTIIRDGMDSICNDIIDFSSKMIK